MDRLLPEPVVVFEVVSPGSVRTDGVMKRREYHDVPSIRQYVLIEQAGVAVTAYFRDGDEPGRVTPLLDGDTLNLPEIGIELPLAEIYEGITFAEVDSPPVPGEAPTRPIGPRRATAAGGG